jgi:hypothetical protein
MKKHKKGLIVSIMILCIIIFFAGIIFLKNKQNSISNKTETVTYTPKIEKMVYESIANINWHGSFEIISDNYIDALDIINNDIMEFETYLINNGISGVTFSTIEYDEIYEEEYDQNEIITKRIFIGYRLIQKVTIHSSKKDEIQKIKNISTKIPELSTLISMRPSYYRYEELMP